jgi:hypothetical protein
MSRKKNVQEDELEAEYNRQAQEDLRREEEMQYDEEYNEEEQRLLAEAENQLETIDEEENQRHRDE